MADEGAGVIVGGDIGGVFAEDIANQLVDGIVALFLKGLIDGSQDVPNFCISSFSRSSLMEKEMVGSVLAILSLSLLCKAVGGPVLHRVRPPDGQAALNDALILL